MRERARRRDQRGATIVEAAFVLPLLLLLVLTMVDIGEWGFQTSQASSAARDGARVGLINFRTADTGGTDFTAIQDAAKARLAGDKPGFSVSVKCVPPESTTTLTSGCDTAVAGCDRIMVTVTWSRKPLSPFVGGLFGSTSVTGESAMVIAGSPTSPSATTTTTAVAPNGCARFETT